MDAELVHVVGEPVMLIPALPPEKPIGRLPLTDALYVHGGSVIANMPALVAVFVLGSLGVMRIW